MYMYSYFHFLSTWGEGDTPSLYSRPTPARYFGSRTMSTYFVCNFVVTNVFCPYLYTILPYKIQIFGVIQKSSKHFSSFIFFPPGERETPPPCPTRSVLRASNNEDLFFYNFVVKNVLCQYLYTI